MGNGVTAVHWYVVVVVGREGEKGEKRVSGKSLHQCIQM